jgi:hypothetical protein
MAAQRPTLEEARAVAFPGPEDELFRTQITRKSRPVTGANFHDPRLKRASQVVSSFRQHLITRHQARVYLGLSELGIRGWLRDALHLPALRPDFAFAEDSRSDPRFRAAAEVLAARKLGLISRHEARMFIGHAAPGWRGFVLGLRARTYGIALAIGALGVGDLVLHVAHVL